MEKHSIHFYDDPNFSYPDFWSKRTYEHEAELMAIRKLLGVKKFTRVVDIGGGFGRLVSLLSSYTQAVVLVEPSEKQRAIANRLASKKLSIQDGSASHTGLKDAYCDLVVMVRVMHHLVNPKECFVEVKRVLKPEGYFVLEFANSLNAKSRIRYGARLKRVPLNPVRVTSSGNVDVPFVNHHPRTVYDLLTQQGFVIEKVISVSNVRSPLLKKLLPIHLLLHIERVAQHTLGRTHFGPSIFVLARRA